MLGPSQSSTMSARDRIIALLKLSSEGLDDDQIANRLGFAQRQQANSRCLELAREGLVARRRVSGKIRNLWIGAQDDGIATAVTISTTVSPRSEKAWCWEGTSYAL